jgi:starvation-inducible outer membrane lipoprotein
MRLSLLVLFALGLAGCVVVPQNRRAILADKIMQFEEDNLEAHRKAKFYSTREAAAGGDGNPAGGGCGCQ